MHGTSAGAEVSEAKKTSRKFGEFWTAEQDTVLRELWTTGLTCTEIGVRLGKTKSSITGRAHRQKLPPRLSPIQRDMPRDHALEAQQREAIMVMHRSGVVDADKISARTGVSRRRIVGILNRAGIKIGRVGPAPKVDKISARLTQWKAAGTSTPPAEIFNHDVDPATLAEGVGASRRHCQFIPGNPRGERTLYCAKRTLTGLAYRPHQLQVARQGQRE